jgi:hypothetical protein
MLSDPVVGKLEIKRRRFQPFLHATADGHNKNLWS